MTRCLRESCRVEAPLFLAIGIGAGGLSATWITSPSKAAPAE